MFIKQRSIQSSLFMTYATIIVLSFISFSLFTIQWKVKEVQSETFVRIEQIEKIITGSIERELQILEMISQNVAYSNLVKERFASYVEYEIEEELIIGENYRITQNIKVLGDLLTAIIGPSRPVDQINLYSIEGDVFATGLHTEVYKEEILSKAWYDEVIAESGKKVLSFSENDKYLSKFSTALMDKSFISLLRLYFNTLNVPQGIVEVKKSAGKIFKSVIDHKPVFGEKVFILDSSGSILFPIAGDEEKKNAIQNYNDIFQSILNEEKIGADSPVYIQSGRSDFSGYTTIIIINKSDLYGPIYDSLKTIILTSLLFIVLALIMSFYAARKITIPIYKIREKIQSIDYESLGNSESPGIVTKILEFKEFDNAFIKLQQELRKSISKQFLLQKQEMQAKMIALQSQMNPHFLYNSLSTIQSMALEGMDKDIVNMCQITSRILRYISSEKEQMVLIQKELDHTMDYLKCLEIRYQGDLSFIVNVTEELHNIRIPKLSFQPLVENSVKYISKNSPPWIIEIQGFSDDECWYLQVIDNGPGFSQAKLDEIKAQIKDINNSDLFPSLEISGMGLLNIYERLRLLYGKKARFILENTVEGTTKVTIGGSLFHE